MGTPSNGGYNPPSSGDDITKIGALSDGFANTATNSTEIDDGSNGYIGTANGDNRNNYNDSGTHDSNNDNSQTNDSGNTSNSGNTSDNSVDVDATVDLALGNGNDRDNNYDWDYTDNTKNISHTDNSTTAEDSYNTSTSTATSVANSNNYSYDDDSDRSYNDSSSHTDNSDHSALNFALSSADNDFADLDNISGVGNLGVAGGDLTFNIGDDFSFTLDVNNLLGGDIGGAGFSTVQANHLADQDYASNLTMENGGANNQLGASGGTAYGAEGIEAAGDCWSPAASLSAGDDISGASTANASAILANSGFHMELVQGANMLSNTVDSTIAGSDVHHTGEDAGAGA